MAQYTAKTVRFEYTNSSGKKDKMNCSYFRADGKSESAVIVAFKKRFPNTKDIIILSIEW